MRNPVFVTGMQGSGTTFTIRLLREMGFDLGAPLFSINERRGLEWEPLRDLKAELDVAMRARGESLNPSLPFYAALKDPGPLMESFKARFEALDYPAAVKLPGIAQVSHILLPGIRPALTYVMARDLQDWVEVQVLREKRAWDEKHGQRGRLVLLRPDDDGVRRSSRPVLGEMMPNWGAIEMDIFTSGAASMGLLIDVLEREELPYRIVAYPRVVKDQEYAWQRFQEAIDLRPEGGRALRPAYERAVDLEFVGFTKRSGGVE